MKVAYVIFLILCFSSTYYGAKGLRKDPMYGEEIHTKSKKFDDTTTRKIESLFIECVDIHKQPAFDHPMLKNHIIQMEPSFKLAKDRGRTLRYDKDKIGFFEDTVCPNGSVPIQRKNDEVQHPLLSGEHLATLGVHNDQDVYRGGGAIITIEQPLVGPYQFSGALIWLISGPANESNAIYFGWMVHPILYGDHLSRFTGLWTGNSYKNYCYNTLCPGFVQINRQHTLGSPFLNVSGRKDQFESLIEVVQDQASGNWWLVILSIEIGYYPKELFTHLSGGATTILFGGATYAPSGQSSPPMGRGTYPTRTTKTSSVFSRIQTYDANYSAVDIDPKKRRIFIDSKKCYGLHYLKYDQNNRVAFSYGGPGGKNCGI